MTIDKRGESMPGFSYVAVDKRGKEKRGSLEAETRERALEQLKAEGLIPVSVREQGALNKEIDFSIGKKVKPRDLSVFCLAVCQYYPGRCSYEGSPADVKRADRE